MGRVIQKTKVGDKVYLECTDLFIDIDKYVDTYMQLGIKKENIKITLEEYPGVLIDIETLSKLKKQLGVLTSHVNISDTEVQKFAKIVAAIRKNIKYAYTKTKLKNVGATQNFIEGLLKGKCVCSGFALITKSALAMHGIEAQIVLSERRTERK